MNAIHSDRQGLGALEQLTRIDLNLFVALDALTRELSVTRAAQRLGVTQSAVSHSLRRLRELLGDPVLVRGRGGMVLTPRAEALMIPLRSGLVTLGRAIAGPERFEPRTAERSFSIATPDLFDVLAMPPLLERIRKEAPGVDITIVPLANRGLGDQLETGEVDVAVAVQLDDAAGALPELPTPGLLRRTLIRDGFSCLIRADHPAIAPKRVGRRRGGAGAAGPALSVEAYAGLSHAVVSPSGQGRGVVDRALERHGLKRRIALRIPNFYSAPAIIAHSDLILTAPTALAGLIPRELPLVALPPPLPLPEHSVNLVWHERFADDPGHRWLRELMVDVVGKIGLARSAKTRRAPPPREE